MKLRSIKRVKFFGAEEYSLDEKLVSIYELEFTEIGDTDKRFVSFNDKYMPHATEKPNELVDGRYVVIVPWCNYSHLHNN